MKLRGTGLLVPVALNYYYARVHAPITTVCVWMRRLASTRTSGVVSRDYDGGRFRYATCSELYVLGISERWIRDEILEWTHVFDLSWGLSADDLWWYERSRVLCTYMYDGCVYTYVYIKEYRLNFDENNMSSLSSCNNRATSRVFIIIISILRGYFSIWYL